MKITVSKRNISQGYKKDCYHCPIALAIHKKIKDKDVRVYEHSVEINDKSFEMPLKAQNFISRFDEGKPVKPFSFILKGAE